MSLLAGVLTVSVAEAPAGATTTQAVTLRMTAGTFATQHGKPGPVPVITTPAFTGTETTKTGTFSGATFAFPKQFHHTPTPTTPGTANPTSTETIFVYTAPSTQVTATLTTAGQFSIGVTVLYRVQITEPLPFTCVTKNAVHVVLTSTAPYTTASKTVTVKSSTIDIPTFSSTNCGLAHGTLSLGFSGAGGELGLTLHGTMAIPSSGTPTATTLSATPASPQVAGTPVAFKATVAKATEAPAPTAGGNVQFRDGTTVLATVPVSGGTATYSTSGLAAGTHQVTARYTGGGGFAASTSAALTYTVKPAPSVAVENLPSSVTGPSTTLHAFTLKVTDPAGGVNLTHLFLKITLTGIRHVTAGTTTVVLQYEDTSSGWCRPVDFHGTTTVTGYVAGSYSTCAPTYPASFALAAGSATTFHLRIGYPTVTGLRFYGPQKVTATLYTGTCTSSTTCTPVAPLSGTAAPSGVATMEVLPPSPLASATTDAATRPATRTVRQTFDVALESEVSPTSALPPFGLPAPTGTVTYTVAGHQIVSTLSRPAGSPSYTPLALFGTTTLAPGDYTVTRTYSGDDVYAGSTLTQTFTVTTAPTGTPFRCSVSGTYGNLTVNAYVSAGGVMPTPELPTSPAPLEVTGASATLTVDPAVAAGTYNTQQHPASIGFSPPGSTPATSGPITFSGTTKVATEVVGTWSGMSTAVPVPSHTAPGSPVAVGVGGIAFTFINTTVNCRAVTASAPIGTTEVAGTTLSASPTGSATVGSPVTLTAHVYPEPATGAAPSQVQFFDGTRDLGTTLVSTAGASRGTATLSVSTLALGSHSLTATWTGTPGNSIPFNASKALSYTVNPTPVTAPVVTTEPQSVGVKAGQTATFTAAARGTSPSVQWQVSSNGGKTWANVSGATSDTYSLTATKGDDANQYRAVFTNSAGTATSNAATLYVTATGYWLTASNGAVYAYGNLPFYGSAGNLALNKPIVGSAATPTGGGYWLVASDGGIFSYGSAQFYGSMGGKSLNAPIVGMAPTPTGKGYWEVASDGGIFAFGAAQFYGSMGGKPLNQPVVGMAATPTGKGYFEVASDGGIFAFGAATFHGSTGSMTLNKPITSMATTPTGNGYWLVASDGGIFAFGTANFYGAAVGGAGAGVATSPVVGMAATTDGGGYLEVEANGRVVQFGDAALAGTALTQTLSGASIVGITS